MIDRNAPFPTVVLSGPTGGLGYELFDQLVSQAYPVIGLGRDLRRIASAVKTASAKVEFVEMDLGDSGSLESALVALRRIIQSGSQGPLVFISNASTIEPIGRAAGLTLPGLELAIRINCLAPLIIANTLADIAHELHRTLLVLDISSGAACRPIRGWQAYCTSKAAYKMALDVLSLENSHVEVIHFDPGVMDTPMQKLIRGQQEADMPEVEVFRAYKKEGLLKAPHMVAAELILLMKNQLS